MTLRRSVLAALAGAVAAACSELGTDPSGVVEIELRPPVQPGIVVGDTLRDTTGVAIPLSASVFDADGNPIADAPVRFYVVPPADTLIVTVDSVTGYVTGDSAVTREVRVIGQLSGLQPFVRLRVTRAPDTVAAVDRTADTIIYSAADTTQLSANPLRVQVAHGTLPAATGADTAAVLGWIVSYQILYNGVPDTTFAAMVSGGTTRSSIDTTESASGLLTGIAERRVLAKQVHMPAGTTDSVTVRATVKYRGQQVKGSPLDFKVIIRLPETPAP